MKANKLKSKKMWAIVGAWTLGGIDSSNIYQRRKDANDALDHWAGVYDPAYWRRTMRVVPIEVKRLR